jgi:hypothetical protein
MKTKILYIHLYKISGAITYSTVPVSANKKSPKPPRNMGTTLGFFPQSDLVEVLQTLPKPEAPTYTLA